jgi:hypothetical protein
VYPERILIERQETKNRMKRWRAQRRKTLEARKEIQLSAPSSVFTLAPSSVSFFRTGNGYSL